MKSYEEMLDSLYARRDAFEAEKQKKKTAALRLSGVLACVCLGLLVGIGAWNRGGAPNGLGEESVFANGSVLQTSTEVSVQQVSDAGSAGEDPSVRYVDVAEVERECMLSYDFVAQSGLSGLTNLGETLRMKLLLHTEDSSYRYHTLVYEQTNAFVDFEIQMESDCLDVQDDWVLLENTVINGEVQTAYYAYLTAKEIYSVSASRDVVCLYIGSGVGSLEDASSAAEQVDVYCELYGDGFVGILP